MALFSMAYASAQTAQWTIYYPIEQEGQEYPDTYWFKIDWTNKYFFLDSDDVDEQANPMKNYKESGNKKTFDVHYIRSNHKYGSVEFVTNEDNSWTLTVIQTGDDGKIYGLDIEIAAAYAASKNLTLVVKNIGFDDIFTQVEAGYADIGMAGITVSEDRAAIYDFTDTYFNASQKLIVAADCTDFDNCKTVEDVENVLASLSGKKIGFQNGTTGGMYVVGDEDWGYAGFANIEGKGYASAQEAVADLVNGNIYAVVVDEAPAKAIVSAVNN